MRHDPEEWRRRRRAIWIRHRYGLTTEQVATLGTRCHICRAEVGKMCIDHDHDTGAIRGLLCDPCNTGLGRFRDDPLLLQAAVRYLKRGPLKDLPLLQ
jgi:hypothetical protein